MPRDSHSRERFSLRCAAARAVFPAAPAAVAAMRAAAAAQPGPLGPALAADMLPERARDAEPEHDDWLEAASGAAAKGAAQGRDDAGQHLSEEPGDCASAAAVQLAAPQLLWLLAAPPAREGTTAAPSPDPSHSPGPSLSAERGQHGASRLIWQCADLTARATAQPLHVQARRTHRLYLTTVPQSSALLAYVYGLQRDHKAWWLHGRYARLAGGKQLLLLASLHNLRPGMTGVARALRAPARARRAAAPQPRRCGCPGPRRCTGRCSSSCCWRRWPRTPQSRARSGGRRRRRSAAGCRRYRRRPSAWAWTAACAPIPGVSMRTDCCHSTR